MNEQYFPHSIKAQHRLESRTRRHPLQRAEQLCAGSSSLLGAGPSLTLLPCKPATRAEAQQPLRLANEHLHNTFWVLVTLHLSFSSKLKQPV